MPLTENDLIRIFEATRAMTSTLRLSDLLSTVMTLAGEVVHAEASSLLLLDPQTDELYFDVAIGEKGGALQQIRLKKGEGIAGWVAMERKAAMVNDVAHDPRWTRKADQTTQFQTRSILAVPMMVKDRLVGVMEAINRADKEPFSDLDQRVLEMFASQAAVAIENARLFESVRQEKEKMDTILSEMVEGAVLLDAQGRVLLANPSARNWLDAQALEGRSFADLEHTFTVTPGWGAMRSSLKGPAGIELVRKTTPALILAGVINPVIDDRGQVSGYLIVIADVTEERREAQLKRNFLALVSHKLKTPLVAIRGFTPMLLEKPEELNSFQKTAIETIDRNSLLLTSLVEKLMWFSTLEAESLELAPKPQTLSSIIDAALTDLAPLLRTRPAEVRRDEGLMNLPAVQVDKLWVKEVVRNLIENAVKFTKDAPRLVLLSARVIDGFVELSIQDRGPGIPPEEKNKIFQKFYQIESSFTGQVEGMGLGLALVKRIIDAHHGAVTVDSVIGQGSTFTISLPLA